MASWTEHEAAVARLLSSYEAIAPGQPVRLAKTTSNLFRPRAKTTTPGLDVSGLDGVIEVDPDNRTADVQGVCTYENLVDATLRQGLIPTVVPQLRTITLGGAVTGLGIESTSLRLGLPHEAVLEMDVLTGAGELITVTPDNEHAEFFKAFPNSYGSLGYATRLKVRLEPATAQVALRHVRAGDSVGAAAIIEEVARTGEYDGIRVDAIDATAFSPTDIRVSLAEFTDDVGPTSDYTGQKIYYRSIQSRAEDRLTMHDYLWRWDTDWFWCSRAFGAQHPLVRPIWPTSKRRSDVYHRLVALDDRWGASKILDKFRRVEAREKVIQDIEVPLDKLGDFLEWFDAEVGMRPVWICPLRTQQRWPTYPLEPGEIYVNLGFWGTVEVPAGTPPGTVNRRIEARVQELGGHKSLYSEAFYTREEFDQMYGTARLERLRAKYDPDRRLASLYDKAVENS